LRVEGARQFVGRDFHARQVGMEAHAELAEAEFAESGFAAFYQREAVRSHLRTVREAGSETCRSGAVPGRQAGALR
jgi:hypothetical protein